MTSLFDAPGALQADLPMFEAQRGGSRDWTVETVDAIRRQFERAGSLPGSERDDDFNALKAEALRQLKAKARTRAVVLPTEGSHGGDGPEHSGFVVRDVKHLDRATTRQIVETVLPGAEPDSIDLLKRMRARLEAVGLHPPTLTIRYKNLTVTGRVTVGTRELPNIMAPVSARMAPALHALGSSKGAAHQPLGIINDVSGVLHPGRLTLLLGPPKSGKTTLLRTLAGLNRASGEVKVEAEELTYNGLNFSQFVPERSAAYISQVDLHYGELTVRETFEFSARVQGPGSRRPMLEEIEAREAAAGITPDPALEAYMRATAWGGKRALITELVIRLLGLTRAADTVVGNAMLRGISGGEKKRVTTGEVVVGPARALFADEISTGLDSNTTFQIMRSLRNLSHVLDTTVVVGLLQPAPETYDLFDDVILLAAGRVVFHGPREEILPFFQSLSIECPPRRGVPDFLQDVTLPSDQEKYWSDESRPWRYITPRTMQKEFAETPLARSIVDSLSQPFPSTPENVAALSYTPYGAPLTTLLRAVADRTWILQRRTKIFSIIRTTQVGLMAILLASVFWRQSRATVDDGNYYMAVLFFSLLYQLLGGTSEMHLLCDRLPVFYKQRGMKFYPGWTFAVSTFLLRVPYSFVESTIWTHIVYWLVGFEPSVRFLMFWGILFLINVWSTLLFQLVAAICRDDTIATALGSFMLLIFINVSGFVIITSSIPPWWLEGLWPNPFFWAMKALAINEFTSNHWNIPNPADPTSSLGLSVLSFRGFPSEYWWCWAAIGYIIATGILNFVLFVAALTFLGPFKRRVVLTPEALEELEVANRIASTPPTKNFHLPVRGPISNGTPQPQADEVAVDSTSPVADSTGRTNGNVCGRVQASAHSVEQGTEHRISQDKFPNEERAGFTAREPGRPRGDIQPPESQVVQQPIKGVFHAGSTEQSGVVAAQDREMFRPSALPDSFYSPQRFLPASERLSFSSQAADEYRRRTALPFVPLVLTFRNVEYSVPIPKSADIDRAAVPSSGPHAGQLRLLKNIDGVFRPHVLTALMGASGAGKSTLLDVLANRKSTGIVTGDIRLNGHPKDNRTFAHVSGYVEQTDVHLPHASVREALEFSATLRLPTTVDKDTRARFVQEILDLVELNRISGAFVGVPGVSGLSVEQRKRLTLAVELVANPSIIFMDEPTSGLDARAANIVMSAIRNTVNSGRTIVCTIHQPSQDIFESFDELLLLKPGGRAVYFGPLGDHAQQLIDYFQALPGVEPIKPRYNPSNWMLETLGKEQSLGIDFGEVYAGSEPAVQMQRVMKEAEAPAPGSSSINFSELHVAPWKTQFSENFKRIWRMYWRSPEYNLTRAAVTLLVAFVFGTLFWRKGDQSNTASGVLDIAGVLFSSVLFLGITDCLTVQHIVALQRTVMYRERAAGYYGVLPFALAQQAVEIPYLLVQAIIYSCIVYWCVYFAVDAGKFFWFVLYFFETLLYFVFFGMMAVALTPAVALANVFCALFFGVFNLFSGFLKPQPAMPVYWKYWVPWANPVAWSIYGLSVSQLGNNGESIVDFTGTTTTVSQFLAQRFNWHSYMEGPIVAILFGYAVLFSAATVLALKYINYQRR